MGTHATVDASTAVAVEAENSKSQVLRVSGLLQPSVKAAPGPSAIGVGGDGFSMGATVVIDMVERQEGQGGLSATLADAAVLGQNISLQGQLPCLDLLLRSYWVGVVSGFTVCLPFFSVLPIVLASSLLILRCELSVVSLRDRLGSFRMTFLPSVYRLARSCSSTFSKDWIYGAAFAHVRVDPFTIRRAIFPDGFALFLEFGAVGHN